MDMSDMCTDTAAWGFVSNNILLYRAVSVQLGNGPGAIRKETFEGKRDCF